MLSGFIGDSQKAIVDKYLNMFPITIYSLQAYSPPASKALLPE